MTYLTSSSHPENYDELRQAAKEELQLAVLVLEDRAEHLKQFLDAFEGAEGSPDEIASLARLTDCRDYEDHLVPAIREIVKYWPQVALAPGERHW